MEFNLTPIVTSLPNDHPLKSVVDSILLPEMEHPLQVVFEENGSEFKDFDSIYRRRKSFLDMKKVKNYGIHESIASMDATSGLKYVALIRTEHFQGFAWTDVHKEKLCGLVLIEKQSDDQHQIPTRQP